MRVKMHKLSPHEDFDCFENKKNLYSYFLKQIRRMYGPLSDRSKVSDKSFRYAYFIDDDKVNQNSFESDNNMNVDPDQDSDQE